MSEQINWDLLSDVEKIKDDSNYLRGTLLESLADPITGSIAADDTQLSKFHGIYQQHDRDLELERKKQKLEPAWSFLIRVRLPGGIATPQQWLTIDQLSDSHANGTIKLTTRQAFQLHGVFKNKLKSTIQGINAGLMDTIAACGDVNRNVMCHPNPYGSAVHDEVQAFAAAVSAHLTPQTTAYHEIWLDKKLVAGGVPDVEPIYGKHYLPRKFKIGVAIPPYNDIDVFSQDLGFIAIEKEGQLIGYNITVGGGFGSTFGMPETYPRIGDLIGFVPADKAIDLAEKVVLVQKDNGNRQNRKQARLKYTIDRLGLPWFKEELNRYLGFELEPAKDYSFSRNGDAYGWHKGAKGKWYLSLFVEGGRVKNVDAYQLKTGLKEIADKQLSDFRLTGNQNLILGNVSEASKKKIISILTKQGVFPANHSGLRQNSIACVAMNTCSLAFAEAERYLPEFNTKLEEILTPLGLFKEEIVIRMTGCPNGCGRPYLAEIALIGKSQGHYNLYLGGSFTGDRLNTLYKETLNEEQLLSELTILFNLYSEERRQGERFGDFVLRRKIVAETKKGKDFKH